MNFTIPHTDSEGYFFLGNLTDLEISDISGESIKITLTAIYDEENMYVLDETYVPDNDGKVRLYDVRSILSPLFPDCISSGTVPLGLTTQPAVRLYVEATDERETKSEMFKCIYSGGKIDADPSGFSKFYTQARNRICHWRNMQLISFPANRKCVLDITYLEGSGTKSYQVEFNPRSEFGIQTINISAGVLMNSYRLGQPKNCLCVEASLYDAEGSISDRIFVEYDITGARENYTTYLFTNFFGMPETMVFRGIPTEEIVMNADLGYFGRQLAKFDSGIYLRTTARTGHLEREGFMQLTDLVQSPTLFKLNDSPKRIVIESVDIQRSRISKTIQSATITYLATERWERSAFMLESAYDRIFDETFDDTFN